MEQKHKKLLNRNGLLFVLIYQIKKKIPTDNNLTNHMAIIH